MADGQVGWQLRRQDGVIVNEWGGVWGQCPAFPNPFTLPSGLVHVHGGTFDVWVKDEDGSLYQVIKWMMQEPPPPMPVLQPYQFFAMLEISGFKDPLYAFIDALPSPQNIIAKAKLERSLEFHRDNDLVLAAQQALKITDDVLDPLWRQAGIL